MNESAVDISWLDAAILGIIQGISEFLPISSSAHLIVAAKFLTGKTLPLALNVSLHLGTFLTLLFYFRKDWFDILFALRDRVLKGHKTFASEVLLPSLILANIPVGIIGILGKDWIERTLHQPQVIVYSLALVGILLFLADRFSSSHKTLASLTIKDAFAIGIGQLFALIPGVSRSGISISAGRALGYDKAAAARFSFLLGAVPMAGAALLEAKHIAKVYDQPIFYVGTTTSFITGCLAISFLLAFLRRFSFLSFAIYRVALAGFVFFFVI